MWSTVTTNTTYIRYVCHDMCIGQTGLLSARTFFACHSVLVNTKCCWWRVRKYSHGSLFLFFAMHILIQWLQRFSIDCLLNETIVCIHFYLELWNIHRVLYIQQGGLQRSLNLNKNPSWMTEFNWPPRFRCTVCREQLETEHWSGPICMKSKKS